MKWNNGQIPDNEWDIERVAYIKDNLYDIIADAIGLLQVKYPTPISLEKDNKIKR